MSGTVVFFLVLYYVVVLGIGYWAVRRGAGNDLEGYLLGGRRVGPMTTALTLQSTSMSGYMFLGAGGLGFAQGYWALWYAVGDIGGGVLNLSVIGRRMRKLSQMMGALTAIEYLEKRAAGRFEAKARRLDLLAEKISFLLVESRQVLVEIRIGLQEVGNPVLHRGADSKRRELVNFAKLSGQVGGRHAITNLPAGRVECLAER